VSVESSFKIVRICEVQVGQHSRNQPAVDLEISILYQSFAIHCCLVVKKLTSYSIPNS
jgi:hypothetical protein